MKLIILFFLFPKGFLKVTQFVLKVLDLLLLVICYMLRIRKLGMEFVILFLLFPERLLKIVKFILNFLGLFL